jgi:hypothetical protein
MQPTNRDSTISYACGHVQTLRNGKGYQSRSEMRCPDCMGFSRTIGHELVCAAARQAEISADLDAEPDLD